jgi:hypothetical protein
LSDVKADGKMVDPRFRSNVLSSSDHLYNFLMKQPFSEWLVSGKLAGITARTDTSCLR